MDLTGHLPELIILLAVILIIWGPGKLPDVGAALGRGIREFRKATAETRDAVRKATAPDEPAAAEPSHTAPVATEPAHAAPESEPAASTGGASSTDSR
jgi:sec-independent protein translocase protein TatA